jgi:hypothetical protein
MSFVSLDKMITPKILTALYVVSSLAAIILLIFAIANGHMNGAIVMAFVLIFNRVFFEGLVVIFKNNEYLHDSREYLKRIAHRLDEKKGETSEDEFDMDDVIRRWNEDKKKTEQEPPHSNN